MGLLPNGLEMEGGTLEVGIGKPYACTLKLQIVINA